MANHAYHPTRSDGKRANEAWSEQVLGGGMRGYMLGVIGCPDGEQAWSSGHEHKARAARLGFTDPSKVYVADCILPTAARLRDFRRLFWPGPVIGRTLQWVLDNIARPWGLVDCDLEKMWSSDHVDILLRCVALGVPNVILSFTTRGDGLWFAQTANRLGMPKRPPQTCKGDFLNRSGVYKGEEYHRRDRYFTKEVVTAHLLVLLEGTGYICSPYCEYRGKGRTGMATICIYKKEK